MSTGAIFEAPLLTEGMAMALPPFESDAPYAKSIWPPTPEWNFVPSESAHTCP